MRIELQRMKIRDVLEGYQDSAELGVSAYGGKLDIRPKYQREFVYDDKQRKAVVDTIKKNFPLNVMYWMINDDGGFEVLDGQQRTISIGQYVNNDFSLDDKFFHNLTPEEQEVILDYELMIYHCEGTDKERLDWFETINIAGEKLTPQELKNAVYTGPWLSDAKLKFSKTNCVAYLLANDGGSLLAGSPIRQEYLETVLGWINNGEVADYMARHQHEENADELWQYFQDVIAWVRTTFPNYRKQMYGQEWGVWYNWFKETNLDAIELEKEIAELIQDDEVTKKSGIWAYVLTRKQSYLNLRAFDEDTRLAAYERQGGRCARCGKEFPLVEMDADHITPWVEGGKTNAENCQMLCREDNRRKGKS